MTFMLLNASPLYLTQLYGLEDLYYLQCLGVEIHSASYASLETSKNLLGSFPSGSLRKKFDSCVYLVSTPEGVGHPTPFASPGPKRRENRRGKYVFGIIAILRRMVVCS